MKPYEDTFLDRFLSVVRDSIPSAELRHQSMALLAEASRVFAPWVPPAGASTRVSFSDGSDDLSLRTPLVLAAGASKGARFLPAFASFGFGAVTVGTATLRPRSGNPLHPRVRTVEESAAIQNAMGLGNPGVHELVRRIALQRASCEDADLAVGVSVAEDPDLLPGESPDRNLLSCLEAAWPVSDYAEINLSCPNTGHERLDREWDRIRRVLGEIGEFRGRKAGRKPVWIKLSPDLGDDALSVALDSVREAGLTGTVLSNTWPASHGTWPDGSPLPELPELGRPTLRGGLSGRPLYPRTLENVRRAKLLQPGLSIVGCGGVETGSQTRALLSEGADLVQIYTVLAFRWMAARRIVSEL
jgi:dihydroorotate dehydrogenase